MQSERTTGKGNCKIMWFKIAYRSFVLCSCDELLKDSVKTAQILFILLPMSLL